VNQKLDRLLLAQEAAVPTTTPAVLGASTMAALKKISGGIVVFTETSGEPVLDEAEALALEACTDEASIVRTVTPALLRLSGSDDFDDGSGVRPVLVNSENIGWLDDPKQPRPRNLLAKPDLFRTWTPFYLPRQGSSRQGSGPGFVFGSLASPLLQRDGCVREVYEAKAVRLADTQFGELVAYQRLIEGGCGGMLFNAREFWLYASENGHPVRLIKSKWRALGSADLVRNFFAEFRAAPPVLRVLNTLLHQLHVRLADSPFLGAGACGRVFRAMRPTTQAGAAADVMALKVFPPSNAQWHAVSHEFEALKAAQNRGAPVARVDPASLHLLDDCEGGGGGFLLLDVGSPFQVTSLTACTLVFTALQALHRAGVIHGDARLPNVIELTGGRLVWIDLLSGVCPSDGHGLAVRSDLARFDARVLAKSILRLERAVDDAVLPETVRGALEVYSIEGTCTPLAVAVWDAMP
jgi:hypothetical protein